MIAKLHRPRSLLALIVMSLSLHGFEARAQSAPDFIFEGTHYFAGIPSSSDHQITSQNDNSSDSTYAETSSASASSNSLTLDTQMMVTRSSGSGVHEQSSEYRFKIWAKYPGDISLSSAGSASYSISGPNGSRIGYGGYVFGSGTFSATQGSGGITESGSSSQSGSSEAHLGCGGGSTKTFLGTTYYRVAPPTNTYGVGGTSRIEGTGAGTVTVTGSQSVTASYATSTPVAVANPASYCSQNLSSTLFYNASYDPDNPSGSQATCSAAWSVTGPNSFGMSASTNGSVGFSPTDAGTYNASLTVTDNEGMTANTTASIFCRPGTFYEPGTTPRSSGEITQSCGGAGDGASAASTSSPSPYRTMSAQGAVAPATGNAKVTVSVSGQRGRGAPMDVDITVNSQLTLVGARQTSIRNGNFTYSIGFYQYGSSRYFLDADGSEFYLGSWSGSITNPAGFMGTFQTISGGHKLTNAGPPGEIWAAGNWEYEFTGKNLTKITDPAGNAQVITWATQTGGQLHPEPVS
jgi:hypothetical protein